MSAWGSRRGSKAVCSGGATLRRALSAVAFGALATGCAPPAPSNAASTAPDCVADRLSDGGQRLRLRDGVELWYKSSGPSTAPALVYLHGGPGYDAYAFEHSAGKLLEPDFRMVYVDQRGCGRSGFSGSEAQYGMQPTVEDLEELRRALAIERWGLIAHSFGGVVAADYIHQHAEHVIGVVLVDTAPEIGRALQHQIDVIDRIADSVFLEQANEVHAIVRGPAPSDFDRLQRLYALLGRVPIQLHVHYASEAAQQAMDGLDAAAGWSRCTSSNVPAAYVREGYLGERADMRALGVPALLVTGSASEAIGQDNLARAAQSWGAELLSVAGAGHFVYFDRPQEFAAVVTRFFEHPSAGEGTAPR